MGGNFAEITAPTKTELKKEVQKWVAWATGEGLTDIRLGWDPDRVVKTDEGYKIQVWAHS